MTLSLRACLLLIGVLFSLALSACAPQTPQAPSPAIDAVTLPGTELRQLESANTGRSYDIYIRFPDEYSQGSTTEYPVLYILDAQWDFKLLDSIYGGLVYDGFVPEMMIVGITYSGVTADYESLRAMDFTPVADPRFEGSGGAPKFHAFLKEELFPFIETNYPADPSRRVLMGSSFAGTFTLYALFAEPELFDGYVPASPAVVYGNDFAFKQEAEYASAHQDLPVRLYLCVGELEGLKWPVEQFMQVLRERDYTGLEMQTQTVEGEGHASTKPECYNRGLRFVFQDE